MNFFSGLCLIFAVTLCAVPVCCASDVFTRQDINRVLYMPQNPSRYLVLQEITGNGRLRCRIYSSRKSVSAAVYEVEKTPFYDTTPSAVLSQYAIYYRAHRVKNNHAMNLWRTAGDNTGRLEILNSFDNERRRFVNHLKTVRRQNRKVEDADDRLDNFHEVLDSCKLHEIISSQLGNNDFALLITMYADFHMLMLDIEKTDPDKSSLYQAAQTMRVELFNQLSEAFREHNSAQTERRDKFLRIYPNHKGARWQKPSPQTPSEMSRCFEESLKAYFSLNDLSSITDPQEWGSAVLNVLMLTGGSKCTADLEKEFDQMLDRLAGKTPN